MQISLSHQHYNDNKAGYFRMEKFHQYSDCIGELPTEYFSSSAISDKGDEGIPLTV